MPYNDTLRLNVGIPVRSLPRESHALFVLHGVELPGAGTKQNKTPISWASLNIFNSKGFIMHYHGLNGLDTLYLSLIHI